MAKVKAENKYESSFQKFFVESALITQLSRFAAVIARRANFTPDSIRRLVEPTREEMILGIGIDPDAGNLVKLQILVSAHLGEAVKWMERYKVGPMEVFP